MSARRLWILVCLLLASAVGAESAFQVFFNGQKSNLKVVKIKDDAFVPVYFPLSEGDSSYNVTVKYDAKSRRIDVRRKSQAAPKRDDSPCYHCSGSGQCQNDYPVGTGNNTAGQTCPMCNGAGQCWHCSGTGKAWK